MTIVTHRAAFGLTIWYDARQLPAGSPSSEVLCFHDRLERDAHAATLAARSSVVDVRSWEADPGFSLRAFYHQPH